MKTITLGVISLLLAFAAAAQTEKPYLTKSFAGANIQNAEVETSGGGIQVTGGDPSQARVEVYVNGNGHTLSADEIKQRLEKYYDVVISLEGGKLSAKAQPKSGFHDLWSNGNSLSISFHVFVPKAVSTHLNTSGGGIHLANLQGTEEFETSGGGLHLDGLSGKIHGRTSGGGIEVSNSNDDINLSTSGGGIHANHCTGNIKLETSGGSLELNDLSGKIEAGTSGGGIHGSRVSGDLSVSTSGGSIHFSDLSCTLDASTSGGGIDVTMVSIGKSIQLNTSAGGISLHLPSGKGLDLALSGQRVETSNLANFSGTTEKDRVNGSVNGGGIPVRLSANSGTVRVAFD